MQARIQDTVRYIATNVDADLRLTSLATRVGLSPFQLHRGIKDATGETPAKLIERIRLHRSAHALLFHDRSVLEIGLEHGYQSHETFTRAFQRKFRVPPVEFRAQGTWRFASEPPKRKSQGAGGYQLSATRVQRLREIRVLRIRRLGPYETVPDTLWRDLYGWLANAGVEGGQCIGIGLDGPHETKASQLRFDACVRIAEPVAVPAPYVCEVLDGSWYAVCTHVGHFATLPEAYPAIYQQALAMGDFELVGLPVMEVYQGGLVDAANPDNQTDVYVPLKEKTPA